MTMSAQRGYDASNFYVWRAADDFAIHLNLHVVTQLTAHLARKGPGNQSSDIRGILIGRTIETPFRATVIEDFELLPCTEEPLNHDSDNAMFEIASRMAETGNEQRAIGFFRSRRDGTLNLGPQDLETFSRLFCEAGNIALLIQTSKRGNESGAALFHWQRGGAHPRDFGFGFPFDAAQLAAGHPGWRFGNPLQAPAPAMMPSQATRAIKQSRPATMTLSAVREPIRWWRLLPTAALVAIGVGALQLAMNFNQTVSASDESQRGLGLKVTSRQHQLEIRWNRQSAAVAAAKNGVMKIAEGGITESVNFDKDQLEDGFVAYTPTTNDVSIRLQVTGQDGGTASESIRAVAIP
jgi:hypothetical protein